MGSEVLRRGKVENGVRGIYKGEGRKSGGGG